MCHYLCLSFMSLSGFLSAAVCMCACVCLCVCTYAMTEDLSAGLRVQYVIFFLY